MIDKSHFKRMVKDMSEITTSLDGYDRFFKFL